MFKKFKKMCVHDGTFHMDDVMAVALLKLLGFVGEILRTRNPEDWKNEDTLAIDVSREYDGVRFFDHHQDESPVREEYYSLAGFGVETPYSASGLVWKHFGRKTARDYGIKTPNGVDKFFRTIDEELIMPIDFTDNGIDLPESVNDDPMLYRMISSINEDDPTSKNQDNRFNIAVDHLNGLLNFYFKKLASRINSEDEIKNLFSEAARSGSRFVRIQPNHTGWKTVLQNSDELWESTSAVKAVLGTRGEDYILIMMPKTRESWTDMRFRLNQSLKEEFPEFVFIHKNGFMGVLSNIDRIEEILSMLEEM